MVLTKGASTTASEMLFSTDEKKLEMKINENAMAHIIARLTDLYEDPIEATVREVISNAIDTTRRLPEDERKAIRITLPSDFSREFIVTDLGEGMSLEVIENIYSQYGASTKGTDMTQIGAYGLGAKAPLSYCSQFTVESTRDGITTEILISSEHNGNYTRILGSKETGNPNGTKVTIPVREMDVRDFAKAAEVYHKYAMGVELEFVGANFDEATPLFSLGHTVVDKDYDGNEIKVEVFAQTKSLEELFRAYVNETISNRFDFLLSGWKYEGSGGGYAWRRNVSLFVELIPGLVDFSSSRDSITKNSRLTHLEKALSDDRSRLIGEKIQELINDGTLTDDTILRVLGSYIAHASITNSPNEKYIKELTSPAGLNYYEKIQNTKGNEFELLISRTPEERFTSMASFDHKYSRAYGVMDKTSVSTIRKMIAIPEEDTRVPATALLTFNVSPSSGCIVVVTETTDADQLTKNIGRTTTFYNRKHAGYKTVYGFTKHTKDHICSVLDGLVDTDQIKFYTEEEFLELTKPAPKGTGTKSADIQLKANIRTLSDDELRVLQSNYTYNFDNPGTFLTKNIAAKDCYNVLIMIDSRNDYSRDRRRINHLLFNTLTSKDDVLKGRQIRLISMTATNLSSDNSRWLADNMDKVLFLSDEVHGRSKTVTENMKDFNMATEDETATIKLDNATPFGRKIRLQTAREMMSFISSLSENEYTKGKINEELIALIKETNEEFYYNRISMDPSEVTMINEDANTELDNLITKVIEYNEENESTIDRLYVSSATKITGLLKLIVDDVLTVLK